MEQHIKTGPRDVFWHLLEMIALYVCVGSFFVLFFQYINVYFPDVLHGDYWRSAKSAIRWPLSVLVIVFPFYLWVTSYLQKTLVKFPERRELKTRKWLLYFTLFLATLVIVGDLIALIFNFLSGGLTTPFVLKVFVILVISSIVFFYYGWNLKKEIPASKHPQMKLFVRGVAAVGILSVLFGFFIVGSPFAERMRQFDERRIEDLSSIQWQIVNFWQTKERLPETLDELRDDIRGFVPPVDPETGEAYEYLTTGEFTFELCATFKTTNKEGALAPGERPVPVRLAFKPIEARESWSHEEGRTCFSRTIDPERYPPFPDGR